MTSTLPHPATSRATLRHTVAGLAGPGLQVLGIDAIRTTPQNPRTAADTGLADLIASLAVETEPYLAQPPLVEAVTDGIFRVIAGERRVRAVMTAGWETLACLVYPRLDPAQVHELRLVENLHRQALDALDEASGLKIAWLTANADALGVGDTARSILATEQGAAATLEELAALLQSVDWAHTRPVVTWDQMLDRLGIDLSKAQRKRRMRLLSLGSELQQDARELGLSAAAMRAVGALQPEQQQRLIAELHNDPGLARKVRRIASTVKKGTYTLDEALDEARGRVRLASAATSGSLGFEVTAATDDDAPGQDDNTEGGGTNGANEQALVDAVIEVINLATPLRAAADALTQVLNGRALADLGEPWGPYAAYAIMMIREATQELPG